MINRVKRIPFFRRLIERINNRLFAHYLPVYFDLYGQGKSQKDDVSNSAIQLHQHVPPGHFYSPIPDPKELLPDQERIFSKQLRDLRGISIPDEAMLACLKQFSEFVGDFPYPDNANKGLRYSLSNGLFDWGEAIVLYAILRQFRPKRIIEVGSGFSSALMLDVNDQFLDHAVEFTFIDPYTERLGELLQPKDRLATRLIRERLQYIDLGLFETLEAGDIAFFDSTHVSKCNSDVNLIFFDLLPRLKPGVLIHFHDVFYPFEYPERWVMEMGVAWNEDYLLRAFLQFNQAFEIFFFNDYLFNHFRSQVEAAFKQPGNWLGSSIWLRKVK